MDTWREFQDDHEWGADDWANKEFLMELYPGLDYEDARDRYYGEHIDGLRQYLKRNRFHTPADYYRVTGLEDPWGLTDLIDGDGYVIF